MIHAAQVLFVLARADVLNLVLLQEPSFPSSGRPLRLLCTAASPLNLMSGHLESC